MTFTHFLNIASNTSAANNYAAKELDSGSKGLGSKSDTVEKKNCEAAAAAAAAAVGTSLAHSFRPQLTHLLAKTLHLNVPVKGSGG